MTKTIVKSLILLLLIIFSCSFVLAANAITLNAPAAGKFVTGTYIINSSLDTNADEIVNVSFFYRNVSSSGAAASWVYIGTDSNETADQTLGFNWTWDTTTIRDIANIEVNATATNLAGAIVTSDTSTGVMIDNGVPTVTFASGSTENNTLINYETTFAVSINADNTIGIENCTLTMNSVTSQHNATDNDCVFSINLINFGISQGEASHVYTITARDANVNETSNVRTIRVNPTIAGGGSSPSRRATIVTEDTTTTDEEPETKTNVVGQAIVNFSKTIGGVFVGIFDFFKNLFSRG